MDTSCNQYCGCTLSHAQSNSEVTEKLLSVNLHKLQRLYMGGHKTLTHTSIPTATSHLNILHLNKYTVVF